MSDLLTSVKQENAEVDYSFAKIAGLGVLGVLFALAFSFFLHAFNAEYSIRDLSLAVSAAALFLIIIFLEAIFIKDKGRQAMIVLWQTLALLPLFLAGFDAYIMFGIVGAGLFLWWAAYSGMYELQACLKIRVFRVARAVFPKAVTGLAIFVAASYISMHQAQGLMLSQDAFRTIVSPTNALIGYVYKGLSLQDTISSTVTKFLDSQFKDNPIYQNLSESQRASFVNEKIAELQSQASQTLGVEVEASQTLLEVAYVTFQHYVMEIPEGAHPFVFIGLGFLIFLLVRSIGTPFYWIVGLIAAAIYELLLAIGFAHITAETMSKEIVILK